MECSGFWTGCGFQWLTQHLGQDVAAGLILVGAILYVWLELNPPRFWFKVKRNVTNSISEGKNK